MKKSSRWLVVMLLAVTASVVALLCDPFTRAVWFGPRLKDVPLVLWQEGYRRQKDSDYARSRTMSIPFRLQSWFFHAHDELPWKSLKRTDWHDLVVSLHRDPSVPVRRAVADDLSWVWETPLVTECLRDLLHDDNNDVCLQALQSLGEIADRDVERVRQLLPDFMELMRTLGAKEGVNLNHLCILPGLVGRFPEASNSIVPKLQAILNPLEPAPKKWMALMTLAKLGPMAKAALPEIQASLTANDEFTSAFALTALAEVGRDDKEVFDFVASKTVDPKFRSAAIHCLGAFRSFANLVLPYLIDALGDIDDATKLAAIDALGGLGPRALAGVPLLIEKLDDENVSIRGRSIQALAKIGLSAIGAVPALEKLKSHPQPWIQEQAALALEKLEPLQITAMAAPLYLVERLLRSPRRMFDLVWVNRPM